PGGGIAACRCCRSEPFGEFLQGRRLGGEQITAAEQLVEVAADALEARALVVAMAALDRTDQFPGVEAATAVAKARLRPADQALHPAGPLMFAGEVEARHLGPPLGEELAGSLLRTRALLVPDPPAQVARPLLIAAGQGGFALA